MRCTIQGREEEEGGEEKGGERGGREEKGEREEGKIVVIIVRKTGWMGCSHCSHGWR